MPTLKPVKPTGPVAPPGTTWPSALAILLVLAVMADAAYLLYTEWRHFSNPDMGTLVIAAALASLALCAPYSFFSRHPREALVTALLALACVAGAHALLLSGRLDYRAPCEDGLYECARKGLNRTMTRYP
jgi:FlaA1/EpsC-like NDP-sugar epimerase